MSRSLTLDFGSVPIRRQSELCQAQTPGYRRTRRGKKHSRRQSEAMHTPHVTAEAEDVRTRREMSDILKETTQRGRCVRFCPVVEFYEIEAYSSMYGLHPREFVFGIDFNLIPSVGFLGIVGVGDSFEEHDSAADDSDFGGPDDRPDIFGLSTHLSRMVE